jgi:hypothetical protein
VDQTTKLSNFYADYANVFVHIGLERRPGDALKVHQAYRGNHRNSVFEIKEYGYD